MNDVTPLSVIVSCAIGFALAGVIYAVAFQPDETYQPVSISSLEDVGLTDAITFELDRSYRSVGVLTGTLPQVQQVIPAVKKQRPIPAVYGGGVQFVPPVNSPL